MLQHIDFIRHCQREFFHKVDFLLSYLVELSIVISLENTDIYLIINAFIYLIKHQSTLEFVHMSCSISTVQNNL